MELAAFFMEIFVIFVLVVLNGLFAMSEIALVSARKFRLRQMSEKGERGAKYALQLCSDPTRFLSTIQIGISLMSILSGVYGGAIVASYLEAFLKTFPFLESIARNLSLSIVVLIITFLFLVVGEIIPKRLALLHSESISATFAIPMYYLSRIAAPAVYIIRLSSDGILKLFGIGQHQEEAMSEDEIKQLFRQGARTGVFHPSEIKLVERVLKLDDRSVGNLMTPLKDAIWFEENEPFRQCMEKVRDTGHSCFPVARKSRDYIIGVVWVKDLLAASCDTEPTVKEIIKPAVYAPEHLNTLQILERFQETRTHMILILDDSETVQGLVTINDILQAIIGELPYPSWFEEPGIIRRDDGSMLLDAQLSVRTVKRLLKISKIPEKKKGSFKNLEEIAISQIGHIPISGERFTWNGYRFEVVDMDGPHVDKILVTAKTETSV
ncbi:MAG: hemolysin family protein [Desulfobacterales bacterium]